MGGPNGVHHGNYFRLAAVEVDRTSMTKNFLKNDMFTPTRGRKLWKEGRLILTLPGVPDKDLLEFKTVGGPYVPHNGISYASTPDCVNEAICRLISCANPDDPGLDEERRATQLAFVDAHLPVFRALRRRYTPYFSDWKGVVQEAMDHAGDPHEKRELRLAALETLISEGRIYDASWSSVVTYKLKKYEWAKNGKYPRMIGDMGVTASLETFRVAKILKKAMAAEPFVYKDCEIIFCSKPKPEFMSQLFTKLSSPTLGSVFYFFSDDSCYSIRMPDGTVRMFNIDISSCDASHGPGLFHAAHYIIPLRAQDGAHRMRAQCMLPIEVSNPLNRRERIRLQPRLPRLYSGHGGTTYYNNVANMMIAIAIRNAGANCPDSIKAAATNAGYKVTVEESHLPYEDLHQLQFLKNSPVKLADGTLYSLLNLGVYFRGMGFKTGIYPGKGPLTPRIHAFNKAVFNGMYHGVSSTLHDIIRARLEADSPAPTSKKLLALVAKLNKHKVRDTTSLVTIPDSELYARYDVTDNDIAELHSLMKTCTAGDSVSCRAISAILTADYDLEVITQPRRYTLHTRPPV